MSQHTDTIKTTPEEVAAVAGYLAVVMEQEPSLNECVLFIEWVWKERKPLSRPSARQWYTEVHCA